MVKSANSAAKPCVLVVDDHESVRVALGKSLARRGWLVRLADNARDALELVRSGGVNVVVADLKLPGMDGIEMLKGIRKLSPAVEVVMITAYGTVESAVEAMKLGAVDFVVKPFKRAVVIEAVQRALARQCGAVLPGDGSRACPEIVGTSRALREVVWLAVRVAASSATVLISGESGTGKELVAEAIHRLSPRRDGPLVKVSCPTLPDTLLASELFGHERGAFTGAMERRRGRFEVADKGTIFLDEIAQLTASTQAKLLRVLQDGCFERLGSSTTQRVDVRVIAATNTNLREAVARGAFRADLYYRLNVVSIRLPPLRERPDDIPLLAEHFLRLYCERNGKELVGITRRAMDCLMDFSWPGNVRELENVIERAVVLARGDRITVDELPEWITGRRERPHELHIPVGTSIREAERRLIEATLRHTRGDKSAAAGLLGVTRRTIYRKLGENEAEGGNAS